MPVNMSYPKPRESFAKFGSIARTDTTAKDLFVLPKDAVITGMYVIGEAASDAGTTATIGIGTSASANEIVAGYDVKTAATGEGYSAVAGAAVGTYMTTKRTADVLVKGIYAESGTGSSAGGPWIVKVEYCVLGGGETITS